MTAGEARVDALLRDVAATAAWPATPDLRSSVLVRIDSATSLGADAGAGEVRHGSAARPRARRLLPALAVAAAALLLLAGVAAALGYRLPGLDIIFVDRLPPAGSGLELGSPVPVADVRAAGAPRVLLPATLPEPDTAFVLGAGDRKIVTVAWRAAPDAPRLPGTDLSLTLMAVPGDTEDDLVIKRIGPGTHIEPLTVDGAPGWWIEGAPHEIFVKRPDGDVGIVPSAIAWNTLVFTRGGTVYRLESALGRDATLAIAQSLR